MTLDIQSNNDENKLRIFFVRHGQTDHNVKKILQGHLDVDINDTGLDQAKKVAEGLRDIKFDKFVTSDLVRCVNTTQEIVKFQEDIPVRTTSKLREREMGVVQGMYLKDALEKYGEDFRNLGETASALTQRVDEEILLIFKEAKSKDYKNVGVCTHGGVLTNYFNYLYRDKQYQLNKALGPGDLRVPFNTSVSVIDLDKSTGEGTIQVFGNTKHLGADLKVKNQLLR